MKAETILIVEDDPVVIRALESKFRSGGYKVVSAPDAGEAIRATVLEQPDLMILDLTLLDETGVNGLNDGLAVLHWLHRTLPESRFPVIIHTASTAQNLVERSHPFEVSAVYRKGCEVNDLVASVREALDKRKRARAA